MPSRVKNTPQAKYHRERRANASEEKKTLWREQGRERQRRFRAKQQKQREDAEKEDEAIRKKRRSETQARYRLKKKNESQTPNQVPGTPNSKAKSIVSSIEKATPTTSSVLKDLGIEKSKQRTVERAIVKATAAGLREKQTRKSILPLLQGSNKKAVSHTLGISRTHFYTRSRRGDNPRLKKATIEAVVNFYGSQEISSPSPNKNRSGRAIKVLKFILKDAYAMFRASNAEHVVNFSTFKRLRPKGHVKLMKSAAWVQCACGICENVSAIMKSTKMSMNRREIEVPDIMLSKGELVKAVVCDIGESACRVRNCQVCSPAMLDTVMSDWLEAARNDVVRYSKWYKPAKPDGSPGKHLRKHEITATAEEMYGELKKNLITYPAHLFNARSQAESFKQCKATLTPDDCVVIVDFAENYVIRQATEEQSAYYCRNIITIHPMVLLFHAGADVVRDSVVIISDDNKHDAAAVNVFFHKLADHVKLHYPDIKNIRVWSDGCSSQYKSRVPLLNIANFNPYLLTWNYFGSRHGKCEADGEAAVVKNYLDRVVKAQEIILNDSEDVYRMLSSSERLITIGRSQRHIYLISPETIEAVRAVTPETKMVPAVKNIRRVHQVRAMGRGVLSCSLQSCYCTTECQHPLTHSSIDYSGVQIDNEEVVHEDDNVEGESEDGSDHEDGDGEVGGVSEDEDETDECDQDSLGEEEQEDDDIIGESIDESGEVVLADHQRLNKFIADNPDLFDAELDDGDFLDAFELDTDDEFGV